MELCVNGISDNVTVNAGELSTNTTAHPMPLPPRILDTVNVEVTVNVRTCVWL